MNSRALLVRLVIPLLSPGAAELHAHGDVHAGIEEMSAILHAHPADASARLARASAHFTHGEYGETLDDLDQLPSHIAAQGAPAILRIRACLKLRLHERADALLATLLAAEPGNLTALRDRAHLRLAQNRHAEALADLDRVIAATPGAHPDLLLARARAAAHLDPAAALAWIDARQLIAPLVVLAEEAVAICENSRQPAAAAERLKKISADLARSEFCHSRRAKLLLAAGEHRAATEAWRDCLLAIEKLPASLQALPAVASLRQAAAAAVAHRSP